MAEKKGRDKKGRYDYDGSKGNTKSKPKLKRLLIKPPKKSAKLARPKRGPIKPPRNKK